MTWQSSRVSSTAIDHRPLRIQVHDFAGHAFAAQLSRELASRGLDVEHAYATQYGSGKGRLARAPEDPDSLSFTAITAHRRFEKYDPIRRVVFERSYARAWIETLKRGRPDVVLVCNTPLFALDRFRRFARRARLPWILWHQDIFSLAIGEEIRKRLPRPLAAVGERFVDGVERNLVRGASQVVAIGEEFTRFYADRWDLHRTGVTVIPNWAPLDEITPRAADNSWAARWVPDRPALLVVYAGTLGRKHNPDLLVDLVAEATARGLGLRLIVASEGEGADAVRARLAAMPDGLIAVIPFQPIEDLPDMFGAADMLLAILEPGASRFSIPSKVLSYLAAGRPVLGLMPADNPAADDIVAAGGFVASPTAQGVVDAVTWLAGVASDRDRLRALGRRSRLLAEERFGIDGIAERFQRVLSAAVAGRVG